MSRNWSLWYLWFLIYCFYAIINLPVNVDDAVDDIVRQFKGVSDGLVRKVVGSSSSYEPATAVLGGNPQRNLSWSADEIGKLALMQSTSESVNSYSDNDDGDKDGRDGQGEIESSPLVNGWHSDNELNSKEFPPRVIKHDEEFKGSSSDMRCGSGPQYESHSTGGFPEACLAIVSGQQLDPSRVPPEVLFISWPSQIPPKMNFFLFTFHA